MRSHRLPRRDDDQAPLGECEHRLTTPFTRDQWTLVATALRFSDREAEVVRCLLDGHTEQTTALRLGLSVHTVHSYVGRIYPKLGVRSRSDLVVRIFRRFVEDLMSDGRDAPQ